MPQQRVMRRLLSLAEARQAAPQSWYRIKNEAADVASVAIHDDISYWGVSAQDFVRDLKAITAGTIRLSLNSPGGDVFDGITIYNALKDHPAAVHVSVDGLAASIASVIAMAGDTITMNRGAMMMIHDASTFAMGNADDLRQTADLLDMASDNIASIYAARAGKDQAHWRDQMRAETWYTAQAAVDAGLADEASSDEGDDDGETADVAAHWSTSIFAHEGDRMAARLSPPAPRAIADPAPPSFQFDADAFREAIKKGMSS